MWLQEIMAREQEILCEELAQFVNVLEGRTDLGVADAKRWTLKEWMATIFPVRQPATGRSGESLSSLQHQQAACQRPLAESGWGQRCKHGSQMWLPMTAVNSLSGAAVGLLWGALRLQHDSSTVCLTPVATLPTHAHAELALA